MLSILDVRDLRHVGPDAAEADRLDIAVEMARDRIEEAIGDVVVCRGGDVLAVVRSDNREVVRMAPLAGTG